MRRLNGNVLGRWVMGVQDPLAIWDPEDERAQTERVGGGARISEGRLRRAAASSGSGAVTVTGGVCHRGSLATCRGHTRVLFSLLAPMAARADIPRPAL